MHFERALAHASFPRASNTYLRSEWLFTAPSRHQHQHRLTHTHTHTMMPIAAPTLIAMVYGFFMAYIDSMLQYGVPTKFCPGHDMRMWLKFAGPCWTSNELQTIDDDRLYVQMLYDQFCPPLGIRSLSHSTDVRFGRP